MQIAAEKAPLEIGGIRPRSHIAIAILTMTPGGDPIEFSLKDSATARATASNYGRRLGWHFVTRVRGKRLRVWRLV